MLEMQAEFIANTSTYLFKWLGKKNKTNNDLLPRK